METNKVKLIYSEEKFKKLGTIDSFKIKKIFYDETWDIEEIRKLIKKPNLSDYDVYNQFVNTFTIRKQANLLAKKIINKYQIDSKLAYKIAKLMVIFDTNIILFETYSGDHYLISEYFYK